MVFNSVDPQMAWRRRFRHASFAVCLCVLTFEGFGYSQGTGNARDLIMSTAVQAGVSDDAAKLATVNDQLVFSLSSPQGTLNGAPVLIGLDVRGRRSPSNPLQIPNEPDVFGLSSNFFMLVEGTGTLPAILPGPALLQSPAYVCSVTMPDLSVLGDISIFAQGVTFDAGAPNGIAFTKTLRFDREILSSPSTLTATEFAPNTLFGYGLCAADLNSDGLAETIVGLPGADPFGVTDAGELRIYFGPSQGTMAVLSAPSPQTGANFGTTVRVEDVTGDGWPDLIIGARFEDTGGFVGAGAAYVFVGPGFTTSVRLEAPVGETNARFGQAVTATDWDGDGIKDVVVAAPKATSGGHWQSGKVYIFRGGTFAFLAEISNPQPQDGAKFGYGVVGGDFNGDGRGDLAIGTPYHDLALNDDTGRVDIYLAPSTLPAATIQTPLNVGALLGAYLAVADANKDGHLDVIMGAEFDNTALPGAGGVRIAFGPSFTTTSFVAPPIPEINGGFGSDVAVGDVNKDGYQDLVVGAFYHVEAGQNQAGQCFVLFGPSFLQSKKLVAWDAAANAQAGRRVACADLDGDGFADVLMAAPFASPLGPQNSLEGSLYLFR